MPKKTHLDYRQSVNPAKTKIATAETIRKQKILNSSEVSNFQDFMDALDSSSIKCNKNGLVLFCLN